MELSRTAIFNVLASYFLESLSFRGEASVILYLYSDAVAIHSPSSAFHSVILKCMTLIFE